MSLNSAQEANSLDSTEDPVNKDKGCSVDSDENLVELSKKPAWDLFDL